MSSSLTLPQRGQVSVERRTGRTVANPGKAGENLRALIDSLNGARGGKRIIGGDELEDVLEPALSLFGPRYCCHARMRCAISSFEVARFASESASRARPLREKRVREQFTREYSRQAAPGSGG
jgi:hypothetical protein